jgi:hypothetical protein
VIAQPKTWWSDEDRIKFNYGEDGALWIECEVIKPPSSAGRAVHVRVQPHLVHKLMQEARKVAIEARSKPMPA